MSSKFLSVHTAVLALFLVLLSLLVMNDYVVTDFPYTHDGENHLARFANYKVAVKEEQFPPRWAPNLHNRYGYPVFNYNYPLANMLSLPFSVLRIEYELTFKILIFLSLLTGGLGTYFLSKKLFPTTSDKAHIFSVGLWYVQPYLHNLLVFRGTIGEIMAMALLPHFAYLILVCKEKISCIHFVYGFVVVSSFLLSHNITVFFGGIVLGVFAISIYRSNIQSWKNLLSFSLPALGSSLWFWIPALLEKKEIVLDGVDLFSSVPLHLVTLQQLLFSPLEFGFSLHGPVDSLGFPLGLISLTVLLISTVTVVQTKNSHSSKIILGAVLTTIFLLFLQTTASKIIWQTTPLLSYIQFPWRLSLFLSLLIPLLATYVWMLSTKKLHLILLILLAISFYQLFTLKPADYFHKTTVDYDAFSQTTSTQNENMPKSFTYTDIADWQPTAQILEGEGEVKVHSWTGSNRSYSVEAKSDVVIVEPTAHFLGWESKVIDTTSSNSHIPLAKYIDNDEIQGRLAYSLKPGFYSIETRFTQNTPARIIGNWISVVSIIFVVSIMFAYVGRLCVYRRILKILPKVGSN